MCGIPCGRSTTGSWADLGHPGLPSEGLHIPQRGEYGGEASTGKVPVLRGRRSRRTKGQAAAAGGSRLQPLPQLLAMPTLPLPTLLLC